ncbi:bifunctionaluridylyltransferase/uridylyl-removing enzyme [Striga asiatica]|uniref:Bifunctionaluridylyltransferase/uridylyl-removing enzyme n=1 Tax=Striga asiatica TaxID=4170 RepID=A0A5A7QGC3_STRAF|nr:bifunctionaluridylyltransferase/uridylyl-removing enzyme [Striga asiatica]
MVQYKVRVTWIFSPEQDRGGGHGCRCLSRHLRSRMFLVNLVSTSGSCHVLWSLPTQAVCEARVVSPGHSLVVWEVARSLGLKVEEALREGFSIIVGVTKRKRQRKEYNKKIFGVC